jgi:hypothetical protein
LEINSLVPKRGGRRVFLKTAVLIEKEYSETVTTETLSFSPSSYFISRFFKPTASASFISYNLDFTYGFTYSLGFSGSSCVRSYIF